MAETALAALYRAVARRLTENSELWGDRAYPDLAKSGTQKPYVVFSYAGGGEINARVQQDAEIVLTVKAVALSLDQAFAASARISTLLNDADASSAEALSAGSEWTIIHTKQEITVHLVELIDSVWVYHEGHRFRFLMERV